MPHIDERRAWFVVISLLLILFISGNWALHRYYDEEVARTTTTKQQELTRFANLIQAQLQQQDYLTASNLIESWGTHSSDIVEIVLTSKKWLYPRQLPQRSTPYRNIHAQPGYRLLLR